MNKHCENCYFKLFENINRHCRHSKTDPVNYVCDKYIERCCKCSSVATHKYGDEVYCVTCLLEMFGVEKVTTTEYYLNFNSLGDSEDMREIIRNLASEINEEIKELE